MMKMEKYVPKAIGVVGAGAIAIFAASEISGCDPFSGFKSAIPHPMTEIDIHNELQHVNQKDPTMLDNGQGLASARIDKFLHSSLPGVSFVLHKATDKHAQITHRQAVDLMMADNAVTLNPYPLKTTVKISGTNDTLADGVVIDVNSQKLFTLLENHGYQFNADGTPKVDTGYAIFALGDAAGLQATAEDAADNTFQRNCGENLPRLGAASILAHERREINRSAALLRGVPGQKLGAAVLRQLANGPMYVRFWDYTSRWDAKTHSFKKTGGTQYISRTSLTAGQSYRVRSGNETVTQTAYKHLPTWFSPQSPNRINMAKEAGASPDQLHISNPGGGCESTKDAVNDEVALDQAAQAAVTRPNS